MVLSVPPDLRYKSDSYRNKVVLGSRNGRVTIADLNCWVLFGCQIFRNSESWIHRCYQRVRDDTNVLQSGTAPMQDI